MSQLFKLQTCALWAIEGSQFASTFIWFPEDPPGSVWPQGALPYSLLVFPSAERQMGASWVGNMPLKVEFPVLCPLPLHSLYDFGQATQLLSALVFLSVVVGTRRAVNLAMVHLSLPRLCRAVKSTHIHPKSHFGFWAFFLANSIHPRAQSQMLGVITSEFPSTIYS